MSDKKKKKEQDLQAARDIVMGDQHNYLTIDRAKFEQILALLRQPGTAIEVGGQMQGSVVVVGDGNRIQVSRAEVEGLAALQPDANVGQREQLYLAGLLLKDTFAPWERLYVPLAGNVVVRQLVEDLPVRYTEFIVPVENQAGAGQISMRPLKDITEAMQNHNAFIILGAPGAGKTTTQQKIAFDAARACLQNGSHRLPLFVRLSEQRDRDPYSFLQAEWERNVGTPFQQVLRAGRILILADGVNEIPREARTERLKAWRYFHQDHLGNNLLIFSGRLLDYENDLDLPRVLVEPLGQEQIVDFLKRHGADGLAARLDDPTSRLLEIANNPLNLLVLTTLYKIDPGQSFTNLGRLFQAFSKSLFNREQKEHPAKMSVEAMRTSLAQMAFAMQVQGEGLTFALETARQALPKAVQVDGEPVSIDPAALFAFGRGATLVDPNTHPDVRFRHHVLQEYFAALELLRRFEGGEDLGPLWHAVRSVDEMPDSEVGAWDPLPEPPATGWEVTTLLACGLSDGPEKFIEAVRQANPVLAGRCIDEAGLPPFPPAGEGQAEQQTIVDRVRQDLLADLYNSNIHLRARLQSGLVLGRVGDPRFAAQEIGGVKVVLPQMLPVPAGRYRVGSTDDDPQANNNERPSTEIDLPAFSIGKWPLTNAEYACFMQAGGYENEQYWQGELASRWRKGEEVSGGQLKTWLEFWKFLQNTPDWKERLEQSGNYSPENIEAYEYIAGLSEAEFKQWFSQQLSQKSRTQPAFWEDRHNNNPSQPVVGVTWFEACAYCAWLSEVTGTHYRLPTEAEWEAAARGAIDNRKSRIAKNIYPWGDEWDAAKANTLEGRVLRPSPVGAYACAGGTGPFGAEDQAGNVWEWTGSLYLPYPYDPQKAEEADNPAERVVRGGSWGSLRYYIRCAIRNGFVPGLFDIGIGFRLASPAL